MIKQQNVLASVLRFKTAAVKSLIIPEASLASYNWMLRNQFYKYLLF